MAIENGLVTPATPGVLDLDAPAGRVVARIRRSNGRFVERCASPTCRLPASRRDRRARSTCPAWASSRSTSPMAAITTPSSSRRRTSPGSTSMSAGDMLRLSPDRAPADEREDPARSIPRTPTIRGVSHVMWTGKPRDARAHARNAVFYGDKAIDRSPCGTGTSARMAQLAAQGQAQGRRRLRAREHHRLAVRRPRRGGGEGRQPRRPSCPRSPAGRGSTGLNTIFVDDRDPFAHGTPSLLVSASHSYTEDWRVWAGGNPSTLT